MVVSRTMSLQWMSPHSLLVSWSLFLFCPPWIPPWTFYVGMSAALKHEHFIHILKTWIIFENRNIFQTPNKISKHACFFKFVNLFLENTNIFQIYKLFFKNSNIFKNMNKFWNSQTFFKVWSFLNLWKKLNAKIFFEIL